MTTPRWKESRYSHDDTLSGAYCRVCGWAYHFHEPTAQAWCPFVPMFDDPDFYAMRPVTDLVRPVARKEE